MEIENDILSQNDEEKCRKWAKMIYKWIEEGAVGLKPTVDPVVFHVIVEYYIKKLKTDYVPIYKMANLREKAIAYLNTVFECREIDQNYGQYCIDRYNNFCDSIGCDYHIRTVLLHSVITQHMKYREQQIELRNQINKKMSEIISTSVWWKPWTWGTTVYEKKTINTSNTLDIFYDQKTQCLTLPGILVTCIPLSIVGYYSCCMLAHRTLCAVNYITSSWFNRTAIKVVCFILLVKKLQE